MSMYSKIEEYIRASLTDDGYAHAHLAGNGAIADLEGKLRSFYGAKHALCVDSATNGLMYLLMAAGLKRREILTTPLSYGGTIAGALALDCKLHFVDIDHNLCLSPEASRDVIRNNPQIQAVIAVDFAGNPHNIAALNKVCQEHGIWHFVDAAQSLGADYGIHDVSLFCDAMVVSFGSGKTVFSGGKGGAIVTNNTSLYEKLISICQHPHRQERDLGIGLSHEFALNGGIHPLAAILACDSFDDSLLTIRQKQQRMNQAIGVLSSFNSVSSICAQSGSTFYHCPFVMKDTRLFDEEFHDSELTDGYYYGKAPFVLLPLQLKRSGLTKRIQSVACPHLEHIMDNLYVLHAKKLKP